MMFGASLLGVTPGRPDRPMGRHVSPLMCHPQEDGPSQRPSSGRCAGVQPAWEVVVATAVDAAAVVAAAADTLLLLHATRYDATSSHHELEAFFFPLLQEAADTAAVVAAVAVYRRFSCTRPNAGQPIAMHPTWRPSSLLSSGGSHRCRSRHCYGRNAASTVHIQVHLSVLLGGFLLCFFATS